MARHRPARPDLAERIAALAERLADEVVAALRAAALEDLLELARPDRPSARPPAARPAPGAAPPRAARRRPSPSPADALPRRRRWPTCSQPDCGGAYYPASGTAHFCYRHFVEAGGQHPSRRHPAPAPPPRSEAE